MSRKLSSTTNYDSDQRTVHDVRDADRKEDTNSRTGVEQSINYVTFVQGLGILPVVVMGLQRIGRAAHRPLIRNRTGARSDPVRVGENLFLTNGLILTLLLILN